PNSDGTWTETVLHRFSGGADGWQPLSPVVLDDQGNLYGTASLGGSNTCLYGCGTVFKLSPGGKFTLLHSFIGGNGARNGDEPDGNLVMDQAGNLYGTSSGGNSACRGGCGLVFKLNPTGKYAVLHRFNETDGGGPLDLLLGAGGSLYGTTNVGGIYKNNAGIVYKL